MRKKFLALIFVLLLGIIITGCESKDGTFTITCATKKEKIGGVETQTVVTYKFNKEQLATEYTSNTTQKFKDKSVYEVYKDAQEETVKNNTEKTITYNLKKDDDKKTLVFTMTLKNLSENATTEEEKKEVSASKILKTNEKTKAECKINGISKNKIK